MNANFYSWFRQLSRCFLFFILLLLHPYLVHAQPDSVIVPYESFRPDPVHSVKKKSVMNTQGSGYLSPWNGSYNSDYYIHLQWWELNFRCDCSSGSYNVVLGIDGVNHNPGWFAGAAYSGYGCRVALGPSRSGSANVTLYEGGDDDMFMWCWSSCGAYWSGTNYYWTAALRPPVLPTATNAKWDYRIDLSWGKSTDIPDANHGYLILRDGVEIGRTANGVRSFSDQALGPNETHNYTIFTIYPDEGNYTHISSGVPVTGTTFDLGLTASTDKANVINLNWNPLDEIPGKGGATLQKYKLDRYDEVKDELTTLPGDITSTDNFPDESLSLIPGFLYKYTLRPYPENAFYPDTAWGKILPNGRIKGKVLSPTGQGVQNIRVCAIRQDSVPQDTTTTYCAVTDTAGTYEIRNIYYYTQAQFKLIPMKEGHGFDPAFEEPTLEENIPWLDGIMFTDTSAFSVTGQVLQQGNQGLCPLKGVEIFVNDGETAEATTDDEGMYAFSVGQIGEYTIKPDMEGHQFIPSQMNYYVVSDTILPAIIDTSTNVLKGVVKASCGIYIGQAKLGITSGTAGNNCFDTIITTDTLTGYYEIRLPAREYEIGILEFYSENPDVESNEVETYFPGRTADLTSNDLVLDFIYRSAPAMEINGFPETGCGDYDGIPILTQGYQYTLEISVHEIFGTQTCLADTGYVIVQNHVGNATEEVDTVYLEGGIAEYSFIPGDPNLITPHLKNLTITAHVGSEYVTESVNVLVQGNKPREQTFTTVSPEIPFLILRDPPGDASSSYLEENTTSELAMKLSAKVSGSMNIWAEVKAGAKFESGFGVMVETEIWGKLRGALEVGAEISNQNEFTLSITNGERFSTSDNPDITGEEGDVFAGSALNIIYALTDVITYDPSACKVNKSVDLAMGVDGFATTFIYTDTHIRNVLIPQLTYLRNLYESRENDSAQIYADQIDVWQQTLKLNEDLKAQSAFIENRSFSSGVAYEAFQEIATRKSMALEFSLYIESTVALEAGVEIGGSGISGGVEIKVRTDLGVGSTVSEMASKKTGYILNDDDEGDYFSVDILRDEVFATPVFRLVSGASSCPWEPFTQPREGVQIISDPYLVNVDDPNGTAVFHLQLANTSQSDEDRMYNLYFDQGSNPDGAIITLGGSPVQGGVPTPYYVQAGKYSEATVTVRRGPEAFDYENLQFTFASGCNDPAVADTALLDVHFESPCSSISITKPEEYWIVASGDNDRLRVRIAGYARDLLNFVKMQVTQAGTSNWQTVSFIDKANLDPVSTETTLLLDQFPDGEYDLRAMLECDAGLMYSEVVEGIIDRHAPELFGLPEPSDLVFDEGDMILATFNEPVNCYMLTVSQVTVENISKDENVSAAAGCNGNVITIIPDLAGTSFAGDTFMVSLSGVEDLFGNACPGDISWTFVIQADPTPPDDEDTDKDGVINSADNCPWSANPGQADMDTDGKGDVCDDDLDGDGVPNQTDNCMMMANPNQEDVNSDGIGDVCQEITGIIPVGAEGFMLNQNYPNPFSDKTTLTFTVPVESNIMIRIFDLVGKEVDVLMNRNVIAGTWEVTWDATRFGNGVYYCSFYAEAVGNDGVVVKTIKMVKQR